MGIVRATLASAVLAAVSLSLAPTPAAAAKEATDKPSGPAAEALQPVARIACARIGECSGIVWLDGAWFVHNDSGDAPVLYRSASLDFDHPEILPLVGAQAVDWEDITVLEGDLLIGDIGDNACARDHLVLYRARYHEPAEGLSGRLELIATYPFRYPDGPHNAEALAVIDSAVLVITKSRKKERTGIYRFDDLRDAALLQRGEWNIPHWLSVLDTGRGGRVTAADFHAASGTLALLTNKQILGYPRDRLTGTAAWSMAIEAGKCEALCFDGDRLVIANEGREVFTVDLARLRGEAR